MTRAANDHERGGDSPPRSDRGVITTIATNPGRHRQRTRLAWTGFLATTPALLLTTALFVVPVILMFWMSLHRWPLLGDPSFIGFDNYTRAFARDTTFIRSLGFTLLYTVIITPVLFVLGLALALFVRRSSREARYFGPSSSRLT